MAIDSIDKLVAAFTGGSGNPPQPTFFNKNSLSGVSAAQLISLWTAGGFPVNGVTPTATPAVLTSASQGALFAFTNPVSPAKAFLGRLATSVGIAATSLYLYDRLVHMGGLSGGVNSLQTISGGITLTASAAAGRCDANGLNVEWFLEWYTATGVTGSVCTVTYTNQAGTAGQTTTVTLPASCPAGRLLSILPNSPDTSIKSIQSIQLVPSTGTVGNIGITAAVRIVEVPGLPGASGTQINTFNWADLGLPQIVDNACLWLAMFTNSTVTGTVQGSARLVVG
jgi:hypothetical protein